MYEFHPGQKVILRSGYGRDETIATVKRVGKLHVTLAEDTARVPTKYRVGSGWGVGHAYNTPSIRPATAEDIVRIRYRRHSLKLAHILRKAAECLENEHITVHRDLVDAGLGEVAEKIYLYRESNFEQRSGDPRPEGENTL